MQYLLYNPISGNGKCRELAEDYLAKSEEQSKLVNMLELDSYNTLFKIIEPEDKIIIFGGDGTLNHFVNNVDGLEINNEIYYYPSGTGNDFAADVASDSSEMPILINKYINNIPDVEIDGKSYKFINGVGYGIDGYCCEIGDKEREKGKKANYTAIAIKGLLFHFKPVKAMVTVDGVDYEFKKVWIAPTMHGRRYGGGMIPTPNQVRNGEDGKLSLMVFHGSSKLKTLMIFPSIFKGEHVKQTKYVTIIEGREIRVRFDRPTPLQIDGETMLGVTEYTAKSGVKAEASAEAN
jgi:diacylglycerol kinase family enzyme